VDTKRTLVGNHAQRTRLNKAFLAWVFDPLNDTAKMAVLRSYPQVTGLNDKEKSVKRNAG